MLFEVAIVAVILGYLLRGRLANLGQVPVYGLLLAVAVVIIQYGSQYAVDLGLTVLVPYGPYIYVASIILLLVVVFLNRRNPAIVLIGFGILLNALVITVNGGKMPVSVDDLEAAGLTTHVQLITSDSLITHQPLTEQTRLSFLADIIAITPPYPRPRVISVGDIVLAIGALWLLVGGMIAHPSVTGKRRAAEVKRLTTSI